MRKLFILFLLLISLPVSAKQYSPTPYNIKFDIPDNYYVITYDTNDKALFQKLNIDVAKLKQLMLNKHILMVCIDPKNDIEIDIIAYTDENSRIVGDFTNGKISDKMLLRPEISKAAQQEMQLEKQQLNIENINATKYLVVNGNIQYPNHYGFVRTYVTIKNGMNIGINGTSYTPREQIMFSDISRIVNNIDYSQAETYTATTTSNVTQNNNSFNKHNPFYKFLVWGILGGLAGAIRYLYEWFKNRKNK